MISRRALLLAAAIFVIGVIYCSAAIARQQEIKYDSTEISKIAGTHKTAFVLFDPQKKTFFRYNASRCKTRFTPASTFKIPNSLIGLESKVVADENFIIKWDGIKRGNEDWNRDHTLASAIKYSVVPYYQELARRVGVAGYKKYFGRFSYGNKEIGGRIDGFWLDNSLKISADEEVQFLKDFYEYNLPFSKKNIDLVKKILPEEIYNASVLKYKTGAGSLENGKYIGWLVGYIEKEKSVCYFAYNTEAPSFEEVKKERDESSRKILKALKLID